MIKKWHPCRPCNPAEPFSGRGADDAVAAAAEDFERAHLSIARREEAERLEFVDDLLLDWPALELEP